MTQQTPLPDQLDDFDEDELVEDAEDADDEQYHAWEPEDEDDEAEPEPPPITSRAYLEGQLVDRGFLQAVEVPTPDQMVRAALEDPAFESEMGLDPVDYLAWAVTCSPSAWAEAAEASGQNGARQPTIEDLPLELQGPAHQAALDQRIQAAREARVE